MIQETELKQQPARMVGNEYISENILFAIEQDVLAQIQKLHYRRGEESAL